MSQRAIDFAIAEGHVRGCDVVMLHAARQASAGNERLETYGGIQIHHRNLTGDPVPALIAASGTAAAVVIGRRGFGGFAGVLLGSVSQAMIQHALCPVFLVG